VLVQIPERHAGQAGHDRASHDYVYGDYELEFFANGRRVDVGSCAGRTASIAGELAIPDSGESQRSTLVVKQKSIRRRDVNMFHYWSSAE